MLHPSTPGIPYWSIKFSTQDEKYLSSKLYNVYQEQYEYLGNLGIRDWNKKLEKKASGYVQGWREGPNQWQGHSETITEWEETEARQGGVFQNYFLYVMVNVYNAHQPLIKNTIENISTFVSDPEIPGLPLWRYKYGWACSLQLSALHIRWPKYWSLSISPSSEYSGSFPLGLTGLISVLSKGLSRVFSSTTVQKHQFFGTQPSLWSTLTSVHDYWENHSFDHMDLCWQSDVSAL